MRVKKKGKRSGVRERENDEGKEEMETGLQKEEEKKENSKRERSTRFVTS